MTTTTAPGGEPDDTFSARKQAAIDFHFAAFRAAIMALRGFGEHESVAKALGEELADTRAEAASIAARAASSGGRRKVSPPLRIVTRD